MEPLTKALDLYKELRWRRYEATKILERFGHTQDASQWWLQIACHCRPPCCTTCPNDSASSPMEVYQICESLFLVRVAANHKFVLVFGAEMIKRLATRSSFGLLNGYETETAMHSVESGAVAQRTAEEDGCSPLGSKTRFVLIGCQHMERDRQLQG